MESISSECTPLKEEYEKCFNKWYSEKFLKGDKEDACKELFIKYRKCISSTLESTGLSKTINNARPHIGSGFTEENK
ncbi:hypothetical protein BB560_002417 [Smittium megazygosporum]|uniref:Mitochondrial distribution and morphology protein 35 n=1 Tax=Smittium megazygosporum TaxID=133381 RepID=A0A2T9ZEV3_9FUNG|nr:hypothetical protein BB560_002417 [Smittium megazygosporum]